MEDFKAIFSEFFFRIWLLTFPALDYRRVQLQEFREDLKSLQKLRVLDLSQNSITIIPEVRMQSFFLVSFFWAKKIDIGHIWGLLIALVHCQQ